MEQLLVRIFDTELGQFYMKYREAQAGVVARAFPPSKRSVKLPLAKVVAKIEPGLFFYVELTRHDSGERLCVLHVDAQSYQNDLAAHLAWEPEAVEYVDGFLEWLKANFRTDAPAVVIEPDKPEKSQRDTTDTRAATLGRVREFHELRKTGKSVTQAAKKAKCDSRTYYDYCICATGEEPISG